MLVLGRAQNSQAEVEVDSPAIRSDVVGHVPTACLGAWQVECGRNK